jgi:photosystem II stability/assembly factor-like uncharacterized protein
MKKTLLITAIAVAVVASVFLVVKTTCGGRCTASGSCSAPIGEEAEGKGKGGPMHPGYFEQWLAMKGSHGNLDMELIHKLNAELGARYAAHKASGVSSLGSVAQLGPSNIGGRTRAIVADKLNANRMIAGGVSGGLWLTTDKGMSWNPVDDRLLTLSVTSIAQDPSATDNWYFTTGEGRGNSAGIPGAGIFKSTDNGVTWAQLPSSTISAFDYTWRIAIDPNTAGELYVATKNEGLWRSTNAGTSWDQVYGTTGTNVSDVELLPSGAVVIGVNEEGIFKSANGNSGTYVESTSGLPVNAFRRIELAYCKGTPTVMYAAIEDSTLSTYYTGLQDMYKSTDAGVTWVDLANPDDDYGYFFSFPWYSLLLEVKPDNPNFVLCGVGDLTYSTDGGATWDMAAYSHADYHTALFDPTDNSKVFVGNDGGFYRYTTSTIASGVLDLNNSYMVTQYYAGYFYPTGLSALSGAQDNGTHQMYFGASDANEVFGGDGSYCAVNQQNGLISYVSYQYGQIFRADDSDNPFPSYNDILFGSGLDNDSDGDVDDGCWFINPFEIHQGDGDQLYFVTSSRVFRTTDGGFTWEPMTNTLGASPYAVGIAHQETDPTVYIGGQDGLFVHKANAASAAPGSEVNRSGSVPASVTDDFLGCLTVHPTNSSIVYACFTNYSSDPRIWRVEDANTASPSWVDISGDLPVGLPVNWVEAHPDAPDEYLVAATDNGLYVTTDGGNTWVEETSIPNVSIHQIRLRKTDRTLFIPTHGRGMWTATLPPMVGVEDPSAAASMQVWPNPVADNLHVSGGKSNYFVVTDVKGREVMRGTLESGQMLDASGLGAGVYLLTVGEETR